MIVSGTVKDKVTGKGISRRVGWEAGPNNPFAKNYEASNLRGDEPTDDDGRFRFVAIPGPVLFQVRVPTNSTVSCTTGGSRPTQKAPKTPFPDEINWRKVIDIKETDREVTVEIELEPAPRTPVRVVDADGKPVTGTHATGVVFADFYRPTHHLDTDAVTVFDVQPDEKRLLAVVHAKRRLVGTQVVTADAKDQVVKLGPGCTLTGKGLDAAGKPLSGVMVTLYYSRREVGEVSDPLNAEEEPLLHVGRRITVTDANGEFRFDAAVPRSGVPAAVREGEEATRPGLRHGQAAHDRKTRGRARARRTATRAARRVTADEVKTTAGPRK